MGALCSMDTGPTLGPGLLVPLVTEIGSSPSHSLRSLSAVSLQISKYCIDYITMHHWSFRKLFWTALCQSPGPHRHHGTRYMATWSRGVLLPEGCLPRALGHLPPLRPGLLVGKAAAWASSCHWGPPCTLWPSLSHTVCS